ncbi:hypothetical protein WJX73_002435 [Symbiochloris irregularis]|uniref:Cullin-4 n=1 Tax=Symbiochloris irregularis TaxID=706552 RepID=A0AAW1NV79_9CHLO
MKRQPQITAFSNTNSHNRQAKAADSQAAPARKLTIKPLKSKPKLPQDFEATTWAKLQAAVQAVHEKRAVAYSLEELYRAVEDMCIHKMADRLHANLQQACDAHIGGVIKRLATEGALDAGLFLAQVAAAWTDHTAHMLTLRSIFLYLDRTHVAAASGVRSLFDMGLQLFCAHLDLHPEVQNKTVAGLLGLVEAERGGEAIDRGLTAHLLRMFSSLGTYAQAFEGRFLQQTQMFYKTEGDMAMSTMEMPDYLLHCERRLQEEYDRCSTYLDPETRKPLIATLEQELLSKHLQGVLDRGFAGLMGAQRLPDLGRLYALAGRVGALGPLKAAFKDYIKATGLALIMDEEKDKEMVKSLLDLKSSLDAVLKGAFQSNEGFAAGLKEAFEAFINARANKPAELIARYLDGELRAGGSSQSEEELEGTLDRALLLFRYISGKDVFEAFYKRDLAKRLLLGKSASADAEKTMIGKLKAECGAQFTNKLEGMFKDVDLSRDVLGSFRQSSGARQRAPAGLDMTVNVLTSGYWPSYPVIDARMPAELSLSQQVFKDFYLSKHSGRRLVWQNSLGSCVLRASFPKGVKELSVSLFQTVVLMLFNDADTLSFADIKDASAIEDKELRRTLQGLACGKMRVLTKNPKGREVEDGDEFSFNEGFSAQLFRIKINSIQLKETVEENKKTNEQVMQDRQYQIDAAIVRVMKTRKTLSHKLLVGELLIQLKFPMVPQDLKKRIESLIDREYLARDPDEPSIYNYLA